MNEDRNTPQQVLFAVMERGSVWPACIQHCRRLTPDSVVIAQDADETPADLAHRVHRRVRTLASEGRTVGTGVIAAADGPRPEATSARVKIALLLLQSMRRGGVDEGKLCLVGSEAMGPDARQRLMALTGMLLSELTGPPPVIDVRFGDGTPSGARHACPHVSLEALARAAG